MVFREKPKELKREHGEHVQGAATSGCQLIRKKGEGRERQSIIRVYGIVIPRNPCSGFSIRGRQGII